ncbi:MAG TPA: hypothetical protein VH164_10375, partial [Ktedonobacteraceae bacterium]|nr:hypothetical protein [Ktedonobacteraceae bacterium]
MTSQESLSIHPLSNPLIRHLARHGTQTESHAGCKSFASQTHPLGGSLEGALPSYLSQTKQA